METLQRMGMGMFVQTVIESAFNLNLLIIIITLHVSIIVDKRHNFLHKITIPYTRTVMIFYVSVFGYNLAQIMLAVYEGIPTPEAGVIMNVFIFVYYLFGEILTVFFLEVVNRNIIQKYGSRFLKELVWVLRAVQVLMVILLVTTPSLDLLYYIDERNMYRRSIGYNLWYANSIVTFIFIGAVCILYWKKIDLFLRKAILICVVFPVAAFFCNDLFPKFDLNNIAVLISAMLVFAVYEQHRARYAIDFYQEMDRMQIKLMLSQIQPHFLYNSLTSIIYYADRDPEKTKLALTDFAKYLRKNLEAIGKEGPVQFCNELEHTKKYLALEKLRFGDDLEIEYDIKDEVFTLPVLTLQPIVENAVKHGIRRKKNSKGKVVIHTWKTDKEHVIFVEDDGVGFDVKKLEETDDTHIGVRNVKKRLMMECGGKLEIDSEPGKGTRCRIVIPET